MSYVEDTSNSEKKPEYETEAVMDEDEEEEVEDEEDEVEEEEEEDGDHLPVIVGHRTGRGLTLKTLLKERVLEPGAGYMTINYLGNKFKGDLLPDGRIRSQETSKIFGTPSAWAIFCKKVVNPDKKSGCGWASVRYRGKKLDSYKNNWFKQKRLEDEKEEEELEEDSGSEPEDAVPTVVVAPHVQEIVDFDSIGNRNSNHDPATMVELTTFQSFNRLQPFNITMSSSAMAVIDVHGHLTTSEVVGYLAGQWDVNNHNLIVSHAFPVRCRLGDSENGPKIEKELCSEMTRLKLCLVGWYHTHPNSPPLPTLRDIDSQLDYEMRMKGYNDATYTPVLGIISSPYEKSPVRTKGIPDPHGNAIGFWVMPPAENKPLEYGKPMSMQFTVVQDAFIPKEALLHMSEVIMYYKDVPDAVDLGAFFEENITYWHKLKKSLKGRVPSDHFQPLIDFLTKIFDKDLPEGDPFASVVTTTAAAVQLPTGPNVLCSPTFHLPSSTSISVVANKENDENVSITKDLESCVSNLLKSSVRADLIPISSASTRKKEIEHSVSISPSLVTPLAGNEAASDSLKSSSRYTPYDKSPSSKSYPPLFQTPLPPLFSLESGKKYSESVHSKTFQSPAIEKKVDSHYSRVSASGSLKDDLQSVDSKLTSAMPLFDFSLKHSTADSKKRESDTSATYLDLRRKVSKDDSKSKVSIEMESARKHMKGKNDSSPVDMSSWYSHNKALQEAFILPPSDRQDPFNHSITSPSHYKDLSNFIQSSEYLLSKWNSSMAAAAALHLPRDSSGNLQPHSFHPSLNLSNDARPTYHSDVPLLNLKYDKESTKEVLSNEKSSSTSYSNKTARDMPESLRATSSEFKSPLEYKDPSKVLDLRDTERGKITSDKQEKLFKEPELLRKNDIRDHISGIDFAKYDGKLSRACEVNEGGNYPLKAIEKDSLFSTERGIIHSNEKSLNIRRNENEVSIESRFSDITRSESSDNEFRNSSIYARREQDNFPRITLNNSVEIGISDRSPSVISPVDMSCKVIKNASDQPKQSEERLSVHSKSNLSSPLPDQWKMNGKELSSREKRNDNNEAIDRRSFSPNELSHDRGFHKDQRESKQALGIMYTQTHNDVNSSLGEVNSNLPSSSN